MTPKFEVGEVVILQSINKPERNGEYQIEGIAWHGDVYKGLTCNYSRDKHAPGYDLGTSDDVGPELWDESALRKKHLPGSLSFRDLVQTLKDPSKCQNA